MESWDYPGVKFLRFLTKGVKLSSREIAWGSEIQVKIFKNRKCKPQICMFGLNVTT